MLPFARILAPVDGSPASEIAVRRSARLMSFPGARVTLFTVTPDARTPEAPFGSLESGRRIENLAADLQNRGIDVVVRFHVGHPVREILSEIVSGRHDLVLMTSRRRPLAGRIALGNVALGVVRHSPAPLLLFRPLAGLDESFFAVERSEPAKFRKVLLMLDGSAEAEKILAPAQQLGRSFESELILFQAVGREALGEDRIEAARTYLSTRADAINAQGISARVLILPGDPVEEALRTLDGDVDTLALATRGRSFWSSAILGSVALGLLRRAEGPVLCLSSHPARLRKGRECASPGSRLVDADFGTIETPCTPP